jgi:hypothetical protein
VHLKFWEGVQSANQARFKLAARLEQDSLEGAWPLLDLIGVLSMPNIGGPKHDADQLVGFSPQMCARVKTLPGSPPWECCRNTGGVG